MADFQEQISQLDEQLAEVDDQISIHSQRLEDIKEKRRGIQRDRNEVVGAMTSQKAALKRTLKEMSEALEPELERMAKRYKTDKKEENKKKKENHIVQFNKREVHKWKKSTLAERLKALGLSPSLIANASGVSETEIRNVMNNQSSCKLTDPIICVLQNYVLVQEEEDGKGAEVVEVEKSTEQEEKQ